MKRTLHLVATLWAGTVLAFGQAPPRGRADVIRELQAGNNQQALALAREALEAAPGDCSLLSLQGIAYTALGQTQPALESFRKALSSCPAYLPALEGAAQIEYARGSTEARPLLERILQLQPGNPTANAMLATRMKSDSDCPAALPHFSSSSPLFPTRPDLVEAYASCLAGTGDLPAALTLYTELLATHPNDTTRYNVALLQWKTHVPADALDTPGPPPHLRTRPRSRLQNS